MQNSFDVLGSTGTKNLPTLSNGEASQAEGHGLVVHANTWPHSLWLDLGIALVVAVAAPLLLKKLLETEFATRLFRTPPSGAKASPTTSVEDTFDFDA